MNDEKMTGLDWYTKFIKEIGPLTDGQVKEFVGNPPALYDHMVAAAKRAAGLE